MASRELWASPTAPLPRGGQRWLAATLVEALGMPWSDVMMAAQR